jgi:hypothetical protein
MRYGNGLAGIPHSAPIQQELDEAEYPVGMSQNQWELLKRAFSARPLESVLTSILYLDSPPIQSDPYCRIFRRPDWLLSW